jgi:heat shock protein HslJ
VSYRHGSESTARPPAGVRLRIAGGQIVGDDGCNSFSGPVTVRSGTLRLGDLATTAMACRHELPLSDYFQGTVTWSMTGQTLTITKDGVGTLTYRRPRPGSPEDLVNRTWVLQGIEHPNTAATPGSAAFEPVTGSTVFIASSGSLTAETRCGEFTAAAQVSTGELTVRDPRFTPHSCPPQAPGLPVSDNLVRATLAKTLAGTVPWRISGYVLTIGPREGPVLQYRRSAAEPGPSPTSTVTVSGVGTAGPPLHSGASLTGN